VLASLNRTSGIPFHVVGAKQAGASREEVISAILVGLPAAGHVVTQALPVAIKAHDERD
jgi:alkylhydroperoxidase/carboxymuconolactone decarboxylase family protein YurZ